MFFSNGVNQLDLTIFQWLNSWVGTGWDWAIVFRAVYLWYAVMAAISLFVIVTFFLRFRTYRRRHLELFIFAFVSAAIARFGVTELIRFFYNRQRPFAVLEGVRVLKYQLFDLFNTADGSFPSGHAALAFAVATAVSFFYPKTSILFFLAALSIGFGRVAAGVHWPSDILGGAIVGIGTAWCLKIFSRKFLMKIKSGS